MFPKLLSSQIIIYNCILFFSFSLSVNYFANFEIVNYIAYALFHLTLVYLVFYFFNFYLIFLSFLYGTFFDIFLIDDISPHLISFLIFVVVFNFTKKYLLNLSSNKVSYLIICITLVLFLSEAILANLQFNYPINFVKLFWIISTTVILFFPSLLIFSKIDKL